MISFLFREYWSWRTLRAYKKWQLIPRGWADDWPQRGEQAAGKREYERCLGKFVQHGGERITLSK